MPELTPPKVADVFKKSKGSHTSIGERQNTGHIGICFNAAITLSILLFSITEAEG
jgi:hypothetical protein